MPQNFLITGMPKTGKTTLLREVISALKKRGLKVGGFISPEEKHHGTRTAFYVMDIETSKKAVLASVKGDGPKVSKYHVNIKSFEGIALQPMKRFNSYDVFIIDEIGRMEMKSRKFSSLLDDLIDSDVPFIASVHKDYLPKFKPYGEVFALNGSNKERIYARIVRKAQTALKKRPKKEKLKPPRPKRKKEKRRPTVKKKAARKKVKKEIEEEEVEEKGRKKGFIENLKDLLGF